MLGKLETPVWDKNIEKVQLWRENWAEEERGEAGLEVAVGWKCKGDLEF